MPHDPLTVCLPTRAAPARAFDPLHWAMARLQALRAHWRRHRDDRLRLDSVSELSVDMLHDIGMNEDLRAHALAQRESQYERLTLSAAAIGSHAGRFGW
jgi:uncharacterized protein YjiS (DUF1127 family)